MLANYRDWLDLFYQSIHHPEDYKVNTRNKGIQRVLELIEYENLTPEQMHQLKVATGRKVVLQQEREEGAMEEKVKMAKKMIQKGYGSDEIIELTGLSKEEIESLSKD